MNFSNEKVIAILLYYNTVLANRNLLLFYIYNQIHNNQSKRPKFSLSAYIKTPECKERFKKLASKRKKRPITSRKTKKRGVFIGENSGNWKGENISDIGKYYRIHNNIKRVKTKPEYCEECSKETKARELHLSFNLFHKNCNPKYYTENPNDYTYRCAKCHKKYDNNLRNQNKKLKIGLEKYVTNN